MMSVERSFEAWEEVQRHGLDLADRLAQGFTGLIQINPPSFPWPHHHQKSKPFDLEFPSQHFDAIRDYSFGIINQPINGVAAVLDVGRTLKNLKEVREKSVCNKLDLPLMRLMVTISDNVVAC
ncbi:hypothetical protein F2Q70_00023411 [Brassica cretica]|uniref:Uncharacterized protein n=1 Tax=Brassica cretica TaxID=69181 RepID=A0A8S9GHV6_BRACR|nr:hypothetical protein F2Q70_00023411 [Brassica cretica]